LRCGVLLPENIVQTLADAGAGTLVLGRVTTNLVRLMSEGSIALQDVGPNTEAIGADQRR
jgi:hypothetical protein